MHCQRVLAGSIAVDHALELHRFLLDPVGNQHALRILIADSDFFTRTQVVDCAGALVEQRIVARRAEVEFLLNTNPFISSVFSFGSTETTVPV